MKIAIPASEQNGFLSSLSGHFGSAPFFALYNTESNSVEFLVNNHDSHEHGSCQPTSELHSAGVNAIVCQGMGVRAISKFNALGIKVLYADNCTSVEGVIRKLNNNELSEFSAEFGCQGHH